MLAVVIILCRYGARQFATFVDGVGKISYE